MAATNIFSATSGGDTDFDENVLTARHLLLSSETRDEERGEIKNRRESPPPPQCPSEMQMKTADTVITIRGYARRSLLIVMLVWLLIVLTCGILGVIILYWKPAWFLKLTHAPCSLTTASMVYIKDAYRQNFVRRIFTATTPQTLRSSSSNHTELQKQQKIQSADGGAGESAAEEAFAAATSDEARKIRLLNNEGMLETHEQLRYFHFQKRTYWFDARTNTFVPLVGPMSFRYAAIDAKHGLSELEAHSRYQLYGKNEITIRVHSYLRTLVIEALNPFYFFQLFSVTVWLFDSYYIFSCCLLIMSCLSLGYTTWQTQRMQRVRHERFESSGTALVVRHRQKSPPHLHTTTVTELLQQQQRQLSSIKEENNNTTILQPNQLRPPQQLMYDESTSNLTLNQQNDSKISLNSASRRTAETASSYRRRLSSRMYAGSHVRSINSAQLVPGDIILIPQQGCEMYCDAIILNGACIVNESTLTGESVPVTKMASVDDDDENENENDQDEENNDENIEESESRAHNKQFHRQTNSNETLHYVAPNTTKANTSSNSANNKGNGIANGPTTAPPAPSQQKLASSKCVLYAGTTVIQTRYDGNEPVKAVVMRTGFSTVKGELVRSILYPKPVDFLFYMEAYKFLGFLSALASIGLVYSLCILLWRARSLQGAVIRSLGLITTVVPPTLPLALTLGVVYAQKRLQRAGLFCISPRMINMAGSVNVCCFDKTGTLTEEGLNLRGVVPAVDVDISHNPKEDNNDDNDDATHHHGRRGRRRLAALVPVLPRDADVDSHNVDSPTTLTRNGTHRQPRFGSVQLERGMATCHALTLIEGKLCGDPLDLEMFHATGWQLDEPDMDIDGDNDDDIAATVNNAQQLRPTIVRPPPLHHEGRPLTPSSQNKRKRGEDDISIIRILPFESQLQRMSVLVVEQQQHIYVQQPAAACCSLYCKGSPEMIVSLCESSSVPDNFDKVLSQYTQQGHRVLALARKSFDAPDDNSGGGGGDNSSSSVTVLQRTRRFKLEQNLHFLGLLVFENRLKPQTIDCIRELQDAHIRPIMITGDNLLTALSVARQCGIIQTDNVMLYDSGKLIPTNSSSSTSSSPVHNGTIVETNNNNVAVALTGEMFSAVRAKLLHEGENSSPETDEYVRTVLERGAVFARMSPPQKELLVEDLRHYAGYFVGMCGDGANDCSALRTAHMGISLSDQEASAAAPFTYKHANVACVPTCIREGRAALDTSFAAFKYMAAYSLTQFFSVLLLYWLNTNLGAYEFLYIDLFEVTLIIFFFGITHAYPRLVSTTPPTRLLAFGPLTSLLGQVSIVLIFQMLAYFLVQQQPWYKNIVAQNAGYNAGGSHSDETYYSYENYAVYAVSSFQYIWLAVAFSHGYPYRKSIFSNWRLIALCIVLVIIDAYVVLTPCSWIVRMFELALPPTWTFRWICIGLVIANFFTAVLFEWVFLTWLNRKLEQRRRRRSLQQKRRQSLGDVAAAGDQQQHFELLATKPNNIEATSSVA